MHKITVHTTVCLTPTKEIVVVVVDKYGDILIFLNVVSALIMVKKDLV